MSRDEIQKGGVGCLWRKEKEQNTIVVSNSENATYRTNPVEL